MKKIILRIGGMSCSACSNGLEKFLKKQNGIINAQVNLVMANATIEYEDHLTINDLNDYIKKAGFQSLGLYKLRDDKKSSQKPLLIGFGVLSIIYLYISMGSMLNAPIFDFLNPHLHPKVFGVVLLVLTIPYLIYGFKIFKNGFKTIIHLNPNMDTLVTIGVATSFIYSIYNLVRLLMGQVNLVHNLYFESSAIVIYLVNLGRVIDASAKEKTKDAIKDLVQITPESALIKKDNEELTVSIDEVNVDDIVIGKTGMKISVDGVVESGFAYIDESFITGESKPVKKEKGAKVLAGSIILNGYIEYLAKNIGKNSTISEVVRLVVEASNTKPKLAKIADVISGYFVPTIIGIAIITFLVYLIITKDFNTSIMPFVNILLIACPCALGLATPLAIVVSQGTLAKNGIFVKKSETLESAKLIDVVVFDKTGTLTYGLQKINQIINYKDDLSYYMSLACSLEAKSTHPISNAFNIYQKEQNLILKDVTDFEEIPGKGLKGVIDDHQIYIGNHKLFSDLNIPNKYLEDEEKIAKRGHTIAYIIVDNEVALLVGLQDKIRPESYELIKRLQELNIEPIMLTGDNKETARLVADEIGIKHIIAEVLPTDKTNFIKQLIDANHHVIMVGDGINDAPALVSSTIGISVYSGTDIAGNAADVILMNDDLTKIIDLLRISKNTIRNIKQNLFWAFFYNILMIPIAIGVLPIKINPMIAGVGMTLSSLCVTINALRLKFKK